MAKFERKQSILVLWRGKKYVVEINSGATLRELGNELQKLTGVKAETMRLIVPQSSHGSSKLLSPFSDEHSSQHLHDIGIIEGKSIRMMGASETEVEEVQRDAKKDLRIAGFDEEEKRQRQLTSRGPQHSLKLPQGPYVFCDFRTLQLPGIELNPPPSEALKRMHMLAADPGIVAIMNKHRWRVGIMTEMAPVGYVGVSPKCILGFNKNHGEEISLRLRTDDLKGFRKYESIKKTLLHELAHMVYSEHDANFYALDKQLNQEAASLDWTRSRSHSLGGFGHSDYLDESVNDGKSSNVFKLGGSGLEHLASARESSVAAACRRLTITSANNSWIPEVGEEPDPDDMGRSMQGGSDPMDTVQENVNIEDAEKAQYASEFANDGFLKNTEPDPDDCQSGPACPSGQASEPHPDDDWVRQQGIMEMHENEPDPDDQELQRIKDPVTFLSSRLQKAIEVLRSEANPVEATTVLQTLFKIIRNVIEHPNDMKYKRLRKGNPAFQKNVAKYKAAMEILFLIGFSEDVIWDEIGNAEPYLILKRNDPGLLWLAKSSLEAQIAY